MSEGVILLAGLPGCGKTTHLCQMCRDGWLVFDDFKAEAFNDSSAFRKSRYEYSALYRIPQGADVLGVGRNNQTQLSVQAFTEN